MLLYATVGTHSRTQLIVGASTGGREYSTTYREFGTLVHLYGIWTAAIPAGLLAATLIIAVLLNSSSRRPRMIAFFLSIILLVVTVAGAFTIAVILAVSSALLLFASAMSLATSWQP